MRELLGGRPIRGAGDGVAGCRVGVGWPVVGVVPGRGDAPIEAVASIVDRGRVSVKVRQDRAIRTNPLPVSRLLGPALGRHSSVKP